jgi:hypothetical protein
MAYFAFNEVDGIAVAPHGNAVAPAAQFPGSAGEPLTPLEWSVVRIARNDGRRTLRAPDWTSTLARLFFSDSNPRLADPRLEALRRLAVLAWHDGPAVPAHELQAFLGAGFTTEQLRAINVYIDTASERDRGTVAFL